MSTRPDQAYRDRFCGAGTAPGFGPGEASRPGRKKIELYITRTERHELEKRVASLRGGIAETVRSTIKRAITIGVPAVADRSPTTELRTALPISLPAYLADEVRDRSTKDKVSMSDWIMRRVLALPAVRVPSRRKAQRVLTAASKVALGIAHLRMLLTSVRAKIGSPEIQLDFAHILARFDELDRQVELLAEEKEIE